VSQALKAGAFLQPHVLLCVRILHSYHLLNE
jgi:hypothetical protein